MSRRRNAHCQTWGTWGRIGKGISNIKKEEKRERSKDISLFIQGGGVRKAPKKDWGRVEVAGRKPITLEKKKKNSRWLCGPERTSSWRWHRS